MKKTCPSCGAELEENAKFCNKCGTALPEENAERSEKQKKDQENKKKYPVKLIVGVVVVICIIIGIFAYVKTRPKTLNLNDYTNCKITGNNGYGMASVSLDWDKLDNDAEEIMAEKDSALVAKYELLEDDLAEVKATPTRNLKNGDKIKIKYTYNNKRMKQYGIQFTGKDQTVKVKGLKDAKIVDVFKHLKLQYTGTSPKLSTDSQVTVTVDGTEFTCDMEPFTNLKSGDKITVTCTSSTADVMPKETKKVIKVPKNVDQYIQDPNDLTADDLDQMKQEAKDKLESGELFEGMFSGKEIYTGAVADNGDTVSASSCEVSNISFDNNAIFLVEQKMSKSSDDCLSTFFLRFELDATVTDEYSNEKGNKYHCYGYIGLGNILRKSDGTLEFDEPGKSDCSNFFTDKQDREDSIEKTITEFYKSKDEYSVTLDLSTKAKKVKEAVKPDANVSEY